MKENCFILRDYQVVNRGERANAQRAAKREQQEYEAMTALKDELNCDCPKIDRLYSNLRVARMNCGAVEQQILDLEENIAYIIQHGKKVEIKICNRISERGRATIKDQIRRLLTLFKTNTRAERRKCLPAQHSTDARTNGGVRKEAEERMGSYMFSN